MTVTEAGTDRAEGAAERAEHEAFARQANRETWDWLARDDRTAVDDERMIHAAHASAFHWAAVGGAQASTRADWLLSHVYAVLGHAEPALRYARHCLATCEREGMGGVDLAYAYEAMARASAADHDGPAASGWRAKAAAEGAAIADDDDRQLFLADLAAGPWFGVSP
ncbi:MAG TPA: hypothetical protein VGN59_05025 [Acidimicrobiia bacterium]